MNLENLFVSYPVKSFNQTLSRVWLRILFGNKDKTSKKGGMIC